MIDKQPTLKELFDRIGLPESNNEIDEFLQDEPTPEIVDTTINNKELTQDSNEFVEVKYENDIYKMWKVEFIRPKITKFLKEEKYPDSLIVYELDKIDIVIFDNKTFDIIPIEIQKTQIFKSKYNKNYYSINHSEFEDKIRRQIENNIKESDKCWFFMDLEYLRYLQSGNLRNNISIDLTWFIELMNKNKLKAFAIDYNGKVKELIIKDFEFIKLTEDQKILNENKLRIYINIVKNLSFNDKEINNFYNVSNDRNFQHDWKKEFMDNSGDDKRRELYGWILYSVSNLSNINKVLNMNAQLMNINSFKKNKRCMTIVGIFDNTGTKSGRGGLSNLVRFIDKFDICKYFPGYIRNKNQWENYKGNNLTYETFIMIASGSLKQYKTMSDY